MTKKVQDMEAERAKAAAIADKMLESVKPIKSDFHFFVMEVMENLRVAALGEIKRKSEEKDEEKISPYLVNSNLNARLLRTWEDLQQDQRDEYFRKEEEDRRRFMEEDEVASRHCFTLTARNKSPLKKTHESPARSVKKEEDEGDEEDAPETSASSPPAAVEKRTQPEDGKEDEDQGESPSKKNRVEENVAGI